MNILMKRFIIVIILSTTIAFLGCEKKTEKPEIKPDTTTKTIPAPVEIPVVVDTVKPEVEIPVVQIPDLKGKWTGKFDSRATVLEITKQTDISIKFNKFYRLIKIINR
jgi:hypothetical protein